jgi:hypothetical protein
MVIIFMRVGRKVGQLILVMLLILEWALLFKKSAQIIICWPIFNKLDETKT